MKKTRRKGVHPNIAFGLALGTVLDSLGITQQELARRAGVSENTMSRWCTGRFRPSRAVQQVLLDAVAAAPKHHVHALARSMLVDPTVTYPDGIDAFTTGALSRQTVDDTKAELARTLGAWSSRLGVKREDLREAFGSLLHVVVRAGIDARTASFLVFGS